MHNSSRDAEKEFMRTHYLLKPSVSLAILDAEEKITYIVAYKLF